MPQYGSPCRVSAEQTIKYRLLKRCPTKCEQSEVSASSRSSATHDSDRRGAEPAFAKQIRLVRCPQGCNEKARGICLRLCAVLRGQKTTLTINAKPCISSIPYIASLIFPLGDARGSGGVGGDAGLKETSGRFEANKQRKTKRATFWLLAFVWLPLLGSNQRHHD